MHGDDTTYEDSVHLARSETISTVSTNATAPNLPGPGRNVGRLTAYLGTRLEQSMTLRFGRRSSLNPEVISSQDSTIQLGRIESNASVSTTATAPNLPGAGRTVGLLLDNLGAHMESFVNELALRQGIGPQAVAREIRRLLGHERTTIFQRHAEASLQLNEKEERALKKRCKRLLKYARNTVSTTQYEALDEIISLTIEDPHTRVLLAKQDLSHYLAHKYNEPYLKLMTSRALDSVENERVHNLWSGVLQGRLSRYTGEIMLQNITESGFDVDGIMKADTMHRGHDLARFLRSLEEDNMVAYLRALKTTLSLAIQTRPSWQHDI
ncbi:hypothetical protein SCHPADRAFT_270515 [Schizopora paradoxa]|uniref:Uncharacterized protein n=1 Tax=Schizopora paradoxa TaxID=27342 RepID=A0A0H2RTK5_9AGAM|nr:hypothetical protein SCHPADRAFT_270515 [Schizopora paradoxa]